MGILRPARAAGIALALWAGPLAAASDVSAIDPLELIRRVVRSQRRVESAFEGATFDQREVRISWDAKGRPREAETRLFYVLAGENGAESSRELVEVDGRPATDDEKRKAAAGDAKGRRRRVEQKAAEQAKAPPRIAGDEDDPLVGSRRLSELIGRYTIRIVGEQVIEGRPAYVLDFSPGPNPPPPKSLGDRALDALEGRAVIDASTFQVRSVEARLTRSVKVAGGLAANVKEAGVSYTGQPAGGGLWFPCAVDLRVTGKKALFFRLDTSFRAEFANLKRFFVETEADVRPEADDGSTR
ncbi:MAG: hypothetical protein WCC53_07490 [Thermoanaerobaculia bacterium]|jgi:hypothetical protein